MASNNSAKPILLAGAVGTVCLLGVAWMFAASSSGQAVIDAAEYASTKSTGAGADAAPEVKAEPEGGDSEEVKIADAGAAAEGTESSDPAKTDEGAAASDEASKTADADEAAKAAEAAKADDEAKAAEAAKAEEEAKVAEAAKADEDAKTAEAAKAEEEAKAAEVAKAEDEAKVAEAAKAEEEAKVAEAAKAEEEAKAAETAKAAEEAKAAEAAKAQDVPPVMMADLPGDAKAGAKVFRKCQACHQIGEGAQKKVGPQLTGVFGRTMASVEDFNYSKGFQKANEAGTVWTADELDAFLTKPRTYMRGTKMAFAGLRKAADRENVIAYMAADGDTSAAAEKAEAPEAPAAAVAVAAATTDDANAAEAAKAEEEAKAAEAAKAEEEAKTAEAAKAEEEAKVAEAAKAEEEAKAAEAAKAEEEAKAAEAAKAEEEAKAAEAAKAEEEAKAAEAAKAEEEAKAAEAAKVEEAPAAAAVAATDLTGDLKAGGKVFRKCKACHQIGEGAKNRVGPMLTGVLGRPIGSIEDFKYSKVFQEANAAGRVWTPEELDGYLTKPKDYMPGTKMAFPGLRKEEDRENIIFYLANDGE